MACYSFSPGRQKCLPDAGAARSAAPGRARPRPAAALDLRRCAGRRRRRCTTQRPRVPRQAPPEQPCAWSAASTASRVSELQQLARAGCYGRRQRLDAELYRAAQVRSGQSAGLHRAERGHCEKPVLSRQRTGMHSASRRWPIPSMGMQMPLRAPAPAHCMPPQTKTNNSIPCSACGRDRAALRNTRLQQQLHVKQLLYGHMPRPPPRASTSLLPSSGQQEPASSSGAWPTAGRAHKPAAARRQLQLLEQGRLQLARPPRGLAAPGATLCRMHA
jgi:hypothetical protein